MKIGFACFFCLFAMRLLGGGVALAGSPNSASAADDPVPVSIENKPVFADMRAQLQAVVNTSGFHFVNRFCVVGYGAEHDDYPFAYIYWPTQNKIIGWASESGQPVLVSGKFSDLKRDILPDGEVTDDYLHRSDLVNIVHDCWKYGSNYVIKKTLRGWVPISEYSQFSTIKAQLQDFVDNNATRKINKFCVIGQKDGGYLAAYVYWRTNNHLIYWLPGPNDQYVFDALTYAIMEVDLKHGLRNEDDGTDMGDEMQRCYAATVLSACNKFGQNFVVNKP